MNSTDKKTETQNKRNFKELVRAKFRAEDEAKTKRCAMACADRDSHRTVCLGGNSSEFTKA